MKKVVKCRYVAWVLAILECLPGRLHGNGRSLYIQLMIMTTLVLTLKSALARETTVYIHTLEE